MAFTADDGLALQPALWAAPAWMADAAVNPDGGSALRD
jgi:hypothetical protein